MGQFIREIRLGPQNGCSGRLGEGQDAAGVLSWLLLRSWGDEPCVSSLLRSRSSCASIPVRVVVPVLRMRRWMCSFTVCSVIPSCFAISLLV